MVLQRTHVPRRIPRPAGPPCPVQLDHRRRPACVTGQFTQTDPERRALGRRGVHRRGIAVSDAPAALLDAVVRLLRLLDEPCERVTHPGDVTGVGRRAGYDNPSH
ncbi:hypothetical protein ACRJ4W_09505 [Streptomyces sp. GLT-R25]